MYTAYTSVYIQYIQINIFTYVCVHIIRTHLCWYLTSTNKPNLAAFPAGKHLDAHPTARCGDAKPDKRYPWTCQKKMQHIHVIYTNMKYIHIIYAIVYISMFVFLDIYRYRYRYIYIYVCNVDIFLNTPTAPTGCLSIIIPLF